MSNHSILEFNHDYCPATEDAEIKWARALVFYLHSGDKNLLPQGVTFKHIRHHSETEPLVIQHIKIDVEEVQGSSNIYAIGYCEELEIARVVFKDSLGKVTGTYDYIDVPAEQYKQWRAASSLGKFFHAEIVGKKKYRKL